MFRKYATAWEMAIKLNLGRLELGLDYRMIFPALLDANGCSLHTPSLAHYHALIFLLGHHGDPFDCLLIAQAQVEGLTIVSCDPHFPAYGVPVLW